MLEAAKRTKNVILGTGTPIQTDVEELWDLLEILNKGADHVMGRFASDWRHFETALPIVIGEKMITDETEAWSLLRNPLPPKQEGPLFDIIRADLGIKDMASYSDRPVTDLSSFTRAELGDALAESKDGLSFFERNNPIVRHTILRKRATLEELNLIDRIAVDIWPREGDHIPMFEGLGLLISAEFDGAYQAAKEFSAALRRRVKSAGFMENLMLQRICSSFASGLSTAKRLMEKRQVPDDENDDFLIEDVAGIIDQECIYLQRIVTLLGRQPTDPKLDACSISSMNAAGSILAASFSASITTRLAGLPKG
jgi:hypothetical protein